MSRIHLRISFHWWWLWNTEQLLAELELQLSCDHVTPAALLSVGPQKCAPERPPLLLLAPESLCSRFEALYMENGAKSFQLNI